MFGRKKVAPSSAPPPPPPRDDNAKNHPGHQAVLRHLADKEKEDPMMRPQLAGKIVYDLFVQMLAGDGSRVRIEDLISALASIGGHLCLVGVLDQLATEGKTPQQIGMVDVGCKDGHHYFFGDAPNQLLLESPAALLSLVLGTAHHYGAPVSLEMVGEVMKRTASQVGTGNFGRPELPEKHRSAMLPVDWVKHGRARMIEALDLYEVPPLVRPTAVGVALQRAIHESRTVLDPLMAARIAIECAVPMAKVDPKRFD